MLFLGVSGAENGAAVGADFVCQSLCRLVSIVCFQPSRRRILRQVREWTGSSWINLDTTRFLYDAWNVVEEHKVIGSTQTLARARTWGSDLSGSLQGAGGVGGLLLTEEFTGGSTAAYHHHYDGNGNVTEITDLTGTSAARYRYDAFGNTLVSTGSYAPENRYRFSTKPLDAEVSSGPLYYYGYRFYDSSTGRWLSRDPIEEEGGVNLYGFVGNDGLNKWDILGLEECHTMSDKDERSKCCCEKHKSEQGQRGALGKMKAKDCCERGGELKTRYECKGQSLTECASEEFEKYVPIPNFHAVGIISISGTLSRIAKIAGNVAASNILSLPAAATGSYATTNYIQSNAHCAAQVCCIDGVDEDTQ